MVEPCVRSPSTYLKNPPLQNDYWTTPPKKSLSVAWGSIYFFSMMLCPTASSAIGSMYACRKRHIKRHQIRTDVPHHPWGTSPYKQCHLSQFSLHMAKQLCRSLLLGILLRSCFLHKWKQRALWFSWSALLLVNRGDRGTRGNSITRTQRIVKRQIKDTIRTDVTNQTRCSDPYELRRLFPSRGGGFTAGESQGVKVVHFYHDRL